MNNFYAPLCVMLAIIYPSHAYAKESWDGIYAGAYSGVSMLTNDGEDYWCWMTCDVPTLNSTDVVFGGTVGANKQVSEGLVVGVEADLGTGGTANRQINTAPNGSTPNYSWEAKIRKQATFRVRAGLTQGRTMAYVTGGFALADYDVSARSGPVSYKDGTPGVDWGSRWKGTVPGYAYGAGIEQRFGRMSVKFEFLRSAFANRGDCYMDLEGPTAGACWNTMRSESGAHYTPNLSTIRLGTNFHF